MPNPATRSLRIGIDAHAIGSRLGGNETYISDVLRGLDGCRQHRYFIYVTDQQAAEKARELCPSAAAIRLIGHGGPLFRLGYKLSALSFRDRVDLLHVQYVAPLIAPPLVVTVHDLSFAHHPEWFQKRELMQFRLTIPWSARRARRVLTISDYSRRDLIETLGLPAGKVAFSHLGLRSIFRPRPRAEIDPLLRRLGIRSPYLLALGNLQPRKNIARLIAAWTALREAQEGFAPQLVLVGKKAWVFDEIFASARASRFSNDIVFTDYVPDDDLPTLLSGTAIFIYPSLFEGFGYPPVEAMGCGAPVITSNVTSLPEVCGEAALYADPTSTADLAAKVLMLYRDRPLQETLRKAGLAQSEKYRHIDVAGVTVRAYEEAGQSK